MFTPLKLFRGMLLLGLAGAHVAFGQARITRDVSYLPEGSLAKLDLYVPEPPPAGQLSPAIVFIHGGAWKSGSKADGLSVEASTALQEAGYVVADIDYRLGRNSWPGNLQDCKNAVRFLRKYASRLKIDPNRIGVAGGSAGGHLALMVGFTAGIRELEPSEPYPGISSAVSCVVDMYGPGDLQVANRNDEPGLQRILPTVVGAFGATSLTADVFRVASPIHYIAHDSPPVLVIQALDDPIMDAIQSTELLNTLKQKGVPSDSIFLNRGVTTSTSRLPEMAELYLRT